MHHIRNCRGSHLFPNPFDRSSRRWRHYYPTLIGMEKDADLQISRTRLASPLRSPTRVVAYRTVSGFITVWILMAPCLARLRRELTISGELGFRIRGKVDAYNASVEGIEI
jgi:hypothetical protein